VSRRVFSFPPTLTTRLLFVDDFHEVCTVKANLSNVPIPTRYGSQGGQYYEVDIDVILLFGATELKAQIAWKENVSRSSRFRFVWVDQEFCPSYRVWKRGLSNNF
jgi:hypothetical protein